MASNSARIDISSWDGSLSPSDFRVAACAFMERWNKFNSALPQWSWHSCTGRPWISLNNIEGYLAMENAVLPQSVKRSKEECCSSEEEEGFYEDEFIDSATLVPKDGWVVLEIRRYDFHILYSHTYRVPVLYFRAYSSDGKPSSLEDIGKDLPANYAEKLTGSKWMFITQEEHPLLNRPWCTLHPCGTSEWMKLLFGNDASMAEGGVAVKKYLTSWFSVVGQVVGMKIPLEMLCSVPVYTAQTTD